MKRIKRFLKLTNKQKLKKIKNYINMKKIKINTKKNMNFIPSQYVCKKNIKNNLPKVSILLPVYNHKEVIIKALNSIIKQTYNNIEIILLDDGSTDGLLDILKPYYNIPNLKIYTQENQKLPRALTHLHKLATGDFITWTSADNIMHKNMVNILVRELLLNPDAALVYGDVTVIGANGKPYYGPSRDNDRDQKDPKIFRLCKDDKALNFMDNFINASFLYRKEASDLLGGVYADDIIGAEDYDFWLRLRKAGKLYHIENKKPLYYYRVHDNSMSHDIESNKIKQHQKNLILLHDYEIEREKYANGRFSIIVTDSVPDNLKSEINNNLLHLPVNIEKNERKYNIYISNKKPHKQDIVIICDGNSYVLYDSYKNTEIVKIPYGIDISYESIKARNNCSRNYYTDETYNINQPIYGCHINSLTIDINFLTNLLLKYKKFTFVVIDEIENTDIVNLCKHYSNLKYIPNKKYGECYKYYSNFTRVICLKSKKNNTNDYLKNIILSYAIGRYFCFDITENFYTIFPYAIKIQEVSPRRPKADYISTNDYYIMDKYLIEHSKVGRLKRIIKYYATYMQEKFVERPAYGAINIPKESYVKKVN